MPIPRRLYHLADTINWPQIQHDGLRCASDLIAAAGVGEIDGRQRTAMTPLTPNVALRDQSPMPPSALAKCLVGMTPAEWYALMNRHVFFCPSVMRLNAMRQTYAARPQVVLIADTDALLDVAGDRCFVTPINTGYALRAPARRGASTFVPIATWRASGWTSESPTRRRSHAIVEVAIRGSLPSLASWLIRARALLPRESFVPEVE